ncbi:MAG: CDP-archaeol synthase [Deltaproteobacteria bacterium]|nr:CDP-archaeol synthase [Deltaproteobacteria bacterium]MBN2671717.1 CDP-archaeol synthase [Deltaproteobacteria bacterium]
MSNLALRIITALIIIPPIMALVLFADPVYVAAAASVLAGMGGYEFANMSFDKTFTSHKFLVSSLCAIVSFTVCMISKVPMAPLVMLVTIAPLNLVLFMFAGKDTKTSLMHAALATTGALYVGGLFGAMGLITFYDQGRMWFILLLSAVILNDTFAYTFGKLFGKHKLHKILSPNKTWEGSAGGILGSLAAVLVMQHFFLKGLELLPAVALGIILGAVSQVGDLMESFIKRSFNVKDASNLIPGHGGILDRCDALMLGAPLVLLFSLLR